MFSQEFERYDPLLRLDLLKDWIAELEEVYNEDLEANRWLES